MISSNHRAAGARNIHAHPTGGKPLRNQYLSVCIILVIVPFFAHALVSTNQNDVYPRCDYCNLYPLVTVEKVIGQSTDASLAHNYADTSSPVQVHQPYDVNLTAGRCDPSSDLLLRLFPTSSESFRTLVRVPFLFHYIYCNQGQKGDAMNRR